MQSVNLTINPTDLLGELDKTKPHLIPGQDSEFWLEFHLSVYRYAERFASGPCLDVGCGYGYGSAHLARRGHPVTGLDASNAAIDGARERYSSENLEFRLHDADTRLPFEEDSFTLVICSEVIEHVQNQEQLLVEVHRVLKPDGVLVLKTPQVTHGQVNPHHDHEFSPEEFRNVVGKVFPGCGFYLWSQQTEMQTQLVELPLQYRVEKFEDPFPSSRAIMVYSITKPVLTEMPAELCHTGSDLLAVWNGKELNGDNAESSPGSGGAEHS